MKSTERLSDLFVGRCRLQAFRPASLQALTFRKRMDQVRLEKPVASQYLSKTMDIESFSTLPRASCTAGKLGTSKTISRVKSKHQASTSLAFHKTCSMSSKS